MQYYKYLLSTILVTLLPLTVQGEPLSLKRAVRQTVDNNAALAESRAAAAVSEQGIKVAEGRHLPRLSLEANITQRSESTAFIPAQSATVPPRFSDSYAFMGPVLTLPIYQGGQVQAAVRLAELRHAMQQDSLVITRNELIANTVATYSKCLQLQTLVDASRKALEALNRQKKDAQLKFNLGRIARVELLKVEVQQANEEQRLLALQEGLKNGGSALRSLMGEAVGPTDRPLQLADKLIPQELQPDFAAGLALAKSKPKFQLYAKGVADASAARRLALGKLLPSLQATAGYQKQLGFNPHFSDGIWYVGGALSLPLFERSSYAELSRERLQQQRAEQKLRAVEQQIRLELLQAASSITESRKRISATRLAVEQAAESFRIEQQKFNEGAGIMADLLLAQSAEAQAVVNHTQALFDQTVSVLNWHRASGNMEVYLQ